MERCEDLEEPNWSVTNPTDQSGGWPSAPTALWSLQRCSRHGHLDGLFGRRLVGFRRLLAFSTCCSLSHLWP